VVGAATFVGPYHFGDVKIHLEQYPNRRAIWDSRSAVAIERQSPCGTDGLAGTAVRSGQRSRCQIEKTATRSRPRRRLLYLPSSADLNLTEQAIAKLKALLPAPPCAPLMPSGTLPAKPWTPCYERPESRGDGCSDAPPEEQGQTRKGDVCPASCYLCLIPVAMETSEWKSLLHAETVILLQRRPLDASRRGVVAASS
jgi:hypothetical protein